MNQTIKYLIVGAIVLQFLTSSYSYAQQDLDRPTGLKRPTAEEREEESKHTLKVEKIHLNKLGLERVNHHRKKKGLSPQTKSVSMGNEIEASVGAPNTQALEDTALASSLPTGVDNSTLKFFPPIRSQGSLNSCSSFAIVYYTMTHMYAMARDLDAKNGGDGVRFSPKWTYNMLNGGANAGTSMNFTYQVTLKHGAATWSEFPYDANYLAWSLNPEVWKSAINRRMSTFGKVASLNTSTGLNQAKQLLLNGYILNFGTYVNSWQYKTIANDPSTTQDDAFVGKAIAYMVNGSNGGHAMTIVGYNDDIWVDINGDGVVQPEEKGAFRVANSWGTSWREAGFVWIAYQSIRTTNPSYGSEGLVWYNELYWITARPAYSPKLIMEFTLNHAKRNQLRMSLGVSDLTKTSPTTSWIPNIIAGSGGAFAFNGTTTPIDGTFYLDMTDIVPSTSTMTRYYLGMQDYTAADVAVLKGAKLIDVTNGIVIPAMDTPKTADATLVYSYTDYQYNANGSLPVAAINATPISGYAPLSVTFSGEGSYATGNSGATITSYSWNFGDGTTGIGPNVTHQYSNYGNFTASLIVTDSRGNSSNPVAMNISVLDSNIKPVAMMNVTPVSGAAPLTVSYSSSSYDPDGQITHHEWQFADGTAASSSLSGTHTYNQEGSYALKLSVVDNNGAVSSTTNQITVSPDPRVIKAPSNLSASAKLRVVTLNWKDNSSNEVAFIIERAEKQKFTYGSFLEVGLVGTDKVSYSENVPAGTYQYRVKAVDRDKNIESTYSNTVQIRVK